MTECSFGMLRSSEAQGLVRSSRRCVSMSIFAAVAAGLAVPTLWPGAGAAETLIEGFAFGCETADGADR